MLQGTYYLFKLLSRTQHERNVVPHAATLLATRLDCVPIVAQNLSVVEKNPECLCPQQMPQTNGIF